MIKFSKFSAAILIALAVQVASVSLACAEDKRAELDAALLENKPQDTIVLNADEGQLIRLPSPAASVYVANAQVADVQARSSGQTLYVFGIRPGQTSFYALDAQDNILLSRTVVVGVNLSDLRNAIRQVSGSTSIEAKQIEDMILLTGPVDNASMAQDIVRVATRYLPKSVAASSNADDTARQYIINHLTINGSNQVNIRVRVAEVARDGVKTLGLGTSIANNNLFGDVNASIGFDAGVTLAGAAGSGGLATTWGATSLSATLDALVTDGLATVLAEPNLTALSGETASFLAGGEFPIPVPDSSGNISIEFREYGVRLSFTPTVVSGNRINLRVRPEVSDRDDSLAVSFSGGSIPGLRTRRAETSVELGSGQSFAIAGLLQNNSSQTISKFPGLGDLPVIGALFRSDRFQHNQSELVIMVTPYLVKPMQADAAMVPTDGFVPPNDIDRWLNGRINSEAPTPAPVTTAKTAPSSAESGLIGDVGYELR